MTVVCEERDGGKSIGGACSDGRRNLADTLSPVPSATKAVIPNAERNLNPNHYNLFFIPKETSSKSLY